MNSSRFKVLISFWVFGLCNNFAYVIMLSAAHDILGEVEKEDQASSLSDGTTTLAPTQGNHTSSFHCNPTSTGAVLLADILPTLLIKFTAPFFIHAIPYNIRVVLCALFAAASFIIVYFSHALWMSLLGVVCASISSGAGEFTFLSFTAFYGKNSVSTWSSGTGGAGIFGSLSYAGLTSVGLSPRNTLLVMLVIPVAMVVFYWFVLPDPPASSDAGSTFDHEAFEDLQSGNKYEVTSIDSKAALSTVSSTVDLATTKTSDLSTFKGKMLLIKPLILRYVVPLVLVYLTEYFINQGLFEFVYFEDFFLTLREQYRWYQVTYQLGVFISRSSVNLFTIRQLWILPVLQTINVVLFCLQVWLEFIPWIWIVFGIILWEGLLGGGAYVNTFYQISKVIKDPKELEFSMGAASISDSAGIALAGAVALPIHDWLCRMKTG